MFFANDFRETKNKKDKEDEMATKVVMGKSNSSNPDVILSHRDAIAAAAVMAGLFVQTMMAFGAPVASPYAAGDDFAIDYVRVFDIVADK